jgi:CRP-like cAMP-binding protein
VDNLLLRAARRVNGRTPLDHVVFQAGERLWGAGEQISHVLFPVRGVISLQVLAADGKQVDIGLLGREGCIDVTSFVGAKETRVVAIGLTDGEALAMRSDLFRKHLDITPFRKALEQYMCMLVVMFNQIAVCGRIHAIEKTVIGRLLLMQDRTGATSFRMTQDFLARVLGVRKATVSRTAAGLKRLGAISYDRQGQIRIVDRKQLELRACSCYRAIKKEADQLITALGGF